MIAPPPREQLQQYVTALNDPRITYIHNDINSGACAVRNQSDYAGARGNTLPGSMTMMNGRPTA